MRIIVCGGRDYHDYERINYCLTKVHNKHGITLLIEGGAKGADAHAATWADRNSVPRVTCHANWAVLGGKAGPIRNDNMIKLLSPDAVIAFPGGRGTDDMKKRAENASISLWVVK